MDEIKVVKFGSISKDADEVVVSGFEFESKKSKDVDLELSEDDMKKLYLKAAIKWLEDEYELVDS